MNNDNRTYHELSHPEKRLFYLQKYYPETPMWNVPLSVIFKFPVNIPILKKAINLFIRNNQNMRIRFTETEAGPKQYIAEYIEKDITVVEFTGNNGRENMHEWAENESRKAFTDLAGGELFRIFVIRLDNTRGGFYINSHHMICDGTSLAFATGRIIEYYEKLNAGETDITEQFPSYFNYLKDEAGYLASPEFEKDRDYWFNKYKTDIEQLELRPGTDNEDHKISRSYHRAPAEVSEKIYSYCEKNNISVFKFFMSSLYAYFFRLTMKEDIVIQTAHHNRTEDFKNSTGMFVSSLPMRFNFSSDTTFKALCDKFSGEFKEMMAHQKFPGDLLSSELRRQNRDPQNLFTITLAQFLKSGNDDKAETKFYNNGESFSLLTFYLSSNAGKKNDIEFLIDYRTSAYQQREINYMATHIINLISAAIDAPDKKISEYDFMSDIEKRRLLSEFNDTAAYYPKDKTFVDIFDEQAEKMPDKKAVVYLDKFITYGELRKKSESLAQKIRALGISRDNIAGIFVDRSIEMFIGAIGVLKSGGAFMPIDTKYPMDRIEFMLEDSKSKVLITQKHLLDKIKFNGTVIDLDDRSLYENAAVEFKNISRPEDLAYVIYTSGSTGKPKGTLIEHRSLLNFAFWYKNSRGITETDAISKHASFGFDASIAEVFPPLIAGAEIHVISEDIKLSLGELNEYFEKNNIRGAFLTTQFAEQFSENIDNRSLRYLDTGGEKLRTFTKRGYDFNNCYGPTECTVYTTFFPVDKMHANIPIGKPLANTKVYILDRFGNLMPEGYPGELCVSGVCLSRGYLNRPEVTAEKFIANPFEKGERLYKTGDLTRWLPDGNIEYIGRIDNQVKLRGFRIELGEIEMEIMKVKGIKNTAVTVVSDGDNKSICAYIVADGEITPDALKKEISQNLPEFMIPNYIVRLDEMPVNASGKIDRKALPAPHIQYESKSEFVTPEGETEEKLAALWKETLALDNISAMDNFFKIGGHSLKAVILQAKIERDFKLRLSIKKIFDLPSLRQMAAYIASASCAKDPAGTIQAEPAAVTGPAGKAEKSVARGAGSPNYVKPEKGVEERLVKIWEEVLDLKGVGAQDNFFAIGGHSIKVVSMQYKIEKEFGTRVEIKKIFGAPTIREMASLIMNMGPVKTDPARREDKEPEKKDASTPMENYPVSSVQKRLFIVENMEGGSSTSYNIPFALKIIGKLNKLKFSESIQKMVDRHEALRTSFKVVDGEFVQTIHESVRMKKTYQEAGSEPIDSYIKDFVTPFDLTKAPLIRVKLLRISDEEHLLLADFHHIIFDGMSLEIFMRELFEIYNGRELPELKEQYKDFCVWQKKFLASKANGDQEKVWFEMLSGELPTLDMPTDFPRPQSPDIKGSHIGFMADSDLSARLRGLAQKTNNTLYAVILAAFNILLSRYSGQEDIIVGTPLVGRPSLESQQMLGMFVNTMPARNYPKPDKKFTEFLEEVRQNFFNIIDNQDYQLDMLIDKLNVKRTNGRSPLFDVVFVYQTSQGIKETAYNDIMVKPHPIETGTAKFDLTLQAFESSDCIKFDLEYRECLFKDDSIKRMSSHLIKILEDVTHNPALMLKEIDLVAGSELKTVLYDFNDTAMDYPKNKTFSDIFDEQAEKTPDKKAVVYLARSITYGELRQKSEMLAVKLRSLGIARDDIAGIFVDRSIEMFIGAVGVLKSGAAFMPIDTKYPLDRIEFMLEDSKSKVLITQKHLMDKIKFSGTVIDLDDGSLYEKEAVSFKNISQPQDLAYVIYTSGSTGKPKGTLIEHHSLLNFSFWYKKTHQLTEMDALAKHASFGFDASIMEVFPPLISGSAIHVISEDIKLSLTDLNDYFEKNNIRGGFLTTQFAEQFNENVDNKSLRYLDAGGEKLRTYIKRGYDFYNGYGPTECTVYTTFFRVDKNYPNIPIGKPLANTRIYVLAKNNKLQPIGVPGELCVAGDCLARGYLGRPDLTAEKFPADPFYPGERMYRTGDLVKWLPDGNIEFLGRIDFQVKIRGFRVELGEIEIALQKHECIEKAVVLAKEDEQENKYLCAFFTSSQEVTDQQLKEFLAKSLANYMVPSRFIRLDEMPVNASGKIDRKAVGNLEVRSGGAEELILASNEREEKISKAWREVLGLKAVGVNENFFDIGGHSLKAVSLAAKLQQEFEVNINDIFKYQTIGALAAHINEKKGTLETKLESLKTKVPAAEEKMKAYLASKEFLKFSSEYRAKTQKYDSIDIHARTAYKAILLTGSTGYLGIYLLHDLLKACKCDIFVPVRGKTPGDSLKRLNEKYRYYFGSELKDAQLARVKILCADLERENLGLDEKTYAGLCETVDCVINSAANVKHYGRYEDFYGPNVAAVENLIKFAATGKKKDLNHVSTMSVIAGKIAGADSAAFSEDLCDIGQTSDNVYIKTKLLAEKAVIEAREKYGLKTNIFRAGNISYNSKTGDLQQNVEENAFSVMIRSFVNLGLVPETSDEAELSFVDASSAALIALFDRTSLHDQIYHIQSSFMVKLSEILLSPALGLNMEKLPFDKFIDRLKAEYTKECRKAHVEKILLHRGWLEDEADYTAVVTLTERTDHLLKLLNFEWPKVDESKMTALIAMALRERIDFLKNITLFKGVDESIMREIAFMSKEIVFDEGTDIVWEGDAIPDIYLLVSGNGEVQKSSKTGWIGTIMLAGKGDFVGLESVLNEPSNVTVEAIMGDMRVLAINGGKLRQRLLMAPELCFNIIKASRDHAEKLEGIITNID